MIVGLGIDLVDVSRLRRILASGSAPRFVARVFTPRESGYCGARRDAAPHYAARFAAKEAASKALGVPDGIRFLDVEVVRGDGPPALVFAGVAEKAARALGVTRVHLSLTHDGGAAAAAVVLESAPEGGR
jgi:holo-[acyl-carrier protein] synthase